MEEKKVTGFTVVGYVVVDERSTQRLCEVVNSQRKKGKITVGGPFIYLDEFSNTSHFCQAMGDPPPPTVVIKKADPPAEKIEIGKDCITSLMMSKIEYIGQVYRFSKEAKIKGPPYTFLCFGPVPPFQPRFKTKREATEARATLIAFWEKWAGGEK
jgi:hypothetical protein